jgi:Uncharacterised protein family (UPF0236)
MQERFSEMENGSIRKESLEERLKDHPELRVKFERMLEIVENAGGDVEKAAEAERRVMEELRQIGNDVLHSWAHRQERKKEEEFNQKPGVNRKVKKTSIGTRGLEGTVEEAGERLWECAVDAGAGNKTKFHCVGDGASWITEQVELRFGAQAKYLIDFFHLCEYLAAAAEVVAGPGKETWMEEKKTWLKANRWADVLESLRPFLESEEVSGKDSPVRACYRYIVNRPDFLDYKGALAAGLPIGSGEIESAHRHVIQTRLKVAGAWWKIENANKMLALRVLRSNGQWEDYWTGHGQKAA